MFGDWKNLLRGAAGQVAGGLKQAADSLQAVSASEERFPTNNILLLGRTGSGKTSLAKTLYHAEGINANISTPPGVKVYSLDVPVDAGTRRLRIADYYGQNIGSLVSAFAKDGGIFGGEPVNSVVLVADLFEPPKNTDIILTHDSQHLVSRVGSNIAYWNEPVLDTVFSSGIVTAEKLRYAAIFINKLDLLPTDEQKKAPRCFKWVV